MVGNSAGAAPFEDPARLVVTPALVRDAAGAGPGFFRARTTAATPASTTIAVTSITSPPRLRGKALCAARFAFCLDFFDISYKLIWTTDLEFCRHDRREGQDLSN